MAIHLSIKLTVLRAKLKIFIFPLYTPDALISSQSWQSQNILQPNFFLIFHLKTSKGNFLGGPQKNPYLTYIPNTGPTSILCVWVKKLMFSYALLKNHSQKTRPAFWGPVKKKMSTLQSCVNHLFASIIILAHGTDLWGPELELTHFKFLLKTY